MKHAGIVHERAFDTRTIKIRQNECKKTQASTVSRLNLKAHISRFPASPNPLLLSIRPTSIIYRYPKAPFGVCIFAPCV
ncbi:hypothetical protein CAMGR0001_1822 [Campylobacter gracilis RM3268]|uniref:Uncharacterized protein n=1 Tax=Campylobacter gracilis RM3268 TaxID=553220 RepID=C8PEC1_9BACT|nr:hypothetical protein CAMGR0001_1822 [Campylobacter gracilis RM3268]